MTTPFDGNARPFANRRSSSGVMIDWHASRTARSVVMAEMTAAGRKAVTAVNAARGGAATTASRAATAAAAAAA